MDVDTHDVACNYPRHYRELVPVFVREGSVRACGCAGRVACCADSKDELWDEYGTGDEVCECVVVEPNGCEY